MAERNSTLACAILTVLLCVLLWTMPHFPTQDGPSHLNTAAILAWYRTVPEFQKYFDIRWTSAGNVLAELMCSVFIRLFSPSLAEHLMLTIFIVLFPSAVRFALKPISKFPGAFSLASLPFAANFFFHMGFWDFCYGLLMFFLGLGVYLRCGARRTAASLFLGTCVSIVIFLFHLAAFAALTLVTLALAAADSIRRMKSCGETLWQSVAPLWFAGAAALPAALISLPWLLHAKNQRIVYESSSLFIRFRSLFGMTFMAGYGDHEERIAPIAALGLAVMLLLAVKNRLLQRNIQQQMRSW